MLRRDFGGATRTLTKSEYHDSGDTTARTTACVRFANNETQASHEEPILVLTERSRFRPNYSLPPKAVTGELRQTACCTVFGDTLHATHERAIPSTRPKTERFCVRVRLSVFSKSQLHFCVRR